ncbi:TolC family protein [Winogradskyella maritima]|uniref:TolC family protein n=1 Tax=Winogradskyella maritima TaxID=1517766 RepID=A0ABV8AI46_9FLAO|nr:TolC family protein [Winogradskyella maritima]
MNKKISAIAVIILLGLIGYAQNEASKIYTLEECVAIALKNNLEIQSSILSAHSAKINLQQAKADLLPTLNGNFNLGVNNGRSIDPFTNDFINQELTFSNLGLRLNMTVFNGFRLINIAKQNSLNKKAANMEVEASKQDLVLNVTLAYLQVLNSKAILQLTEQRYETTKEQLKIQKEFYKNESGNPADYLDILGQLANDETSILDAHSDLNNARLSLSRLLNLKENITIENKDFFLDFKPYGLSVNEVYLETVANLAIFQANKSRLEAAEKGVSIAKSQFTPEVSIFGGLNSNYSSVAQIFNSTGQSIVETGDFVTIDGQDFQVMTQQTSFNPERIGYREQLDNNLNTVIGIGVRVPIFNGFRAKNNVALEKIKVKESIVELQRTHLEVENAIDQIYFDMEVAYKRLQSLLKQLEAYEESFRVNDIRFRNGISNFLNYINSKNNLDNAKVNFVNTKYEYLLFVRVLDYYRGNVL